MFRRALLRHSQVAKGAVSMRSLSSVSPASRLTLRSQQQQQHPSQLLKSLCPQLCRRYASTESEAGKKDEVSSNGNGAGKTEPAENGAEDPVGALQKEVEGKNREIVDLKDKYLRSIADFRNLQERTRREVESARLFALQKFAGDLVESIDNLDRALGAVPKDKLTEAEENKDLFELYNGLRMTEKILMNTLKKHGLERFDPLEAADGQPQKFDPKLHEATFMAPSPDKNDGDVMFTQSKGFMLNGRVLRAAKVGVVKNS